MNRDPKTPLGWALLVGAFTIGLPWAAVNAVIKFASGGKFEEAGTRLYAFMESAGRLGDEYASVDRHG